MVSDPTSWDEKKMALLDLPNVIYADQLYSFQAPLPGHHIVLNEIRLLATKSRDIDGVVLAVAPFRSHCAVIVEGPAGTAVAVVAQSPAVLNNLLQPVFRILGPSYVPFSL